MLNGIATGLYVKIALPVKCHSPTSIFVITDSCIDMPVRAPQLLPCLLLYIQTFLWMHVAQRLLSLRDILQRYSYANMGEKFTKRPAQKDSYQVISLPSLFGNAMTNMGRKSMHMLETSGSKRFLSGLISSKFIASEYFSCLSSSSINSLLEVNCICGLVYTCTVEIICIQSTVKVSVAQTSYQLMT